MQNVLAQRQRSRQQRAQANGKALRCSFICFFHSNQRGPLWVIRQETRGLEGPSRARGPKTGSEEWRLNDPRDKPAGSEATSLVCSQRARCPAPGKTQDLRQTAALENLLCFFSSASEEFDSINCIFWEATSDLLGPAHRTHALEKGTWPTNKTLGD